MFGDKKEDKKEDKKKKEVKKDEPLNEMQIAHLKRMEEAEK